MYPVMSKNEDKLRKKRMKQEHKPEKKRQKALLAGLLPAHVQESSFYVRFAESTKGILYTVLAVSILVAAVLGGSGLILTLEDIIDSLIIATLGKVLIGVIAIALLLYGLKNPRILK
jgi:hypothetical protein